MEEAHVVAEVLRAIANPYRLMILCLLEKQTLSVSKLHETINDISMAALSQHLSALKALGYIQSEKKGQHVNYSLKDEKIIQVVHLLSRLYCQGEKK